MARINQPEFGLEYHRNDSISKAGLSRINALPRIPGIRSCRRFSADQSAQMLNIAPGTNYDEKVQDARSLSRYIFGFLIGLFLFALLIRSSDSLLSDPDTYWHITVGEKIWETGTIPQVDVWSHTF